MKPIKCPVPVTHALEAWAFSRAARSLAASRSKDCHADIYLREQAAKYAALAEKEQERIAKARGDDA